MDREHHQDCTLLALPTEILVHIISYVTILRERINLRYVSRRLQSACETPSLWREFEWLYYHTGDERCVSNILKLYGHHVKLLSFPHHVSSTSKLVKTWTYCSNAVQLYVPTIKLNFEQIQELLLHLRHLQSLAIQWESNTKQILELIVTTSTSLNELTIRESRMMSADLLGFSRKSVQLWLPYWIASGFVPRNLNFIVGNKDRLEDYLLDAALRSMYNSPGGSCGQLRLYNVLKMPLDLLPVLPLFQVEFGRTSTLPFVSSGFFKSSSLLITDTTHHNKVMYKASLQQKQLVPQVWIKRGFTNFEFLTEFNISSCSLQSNQLGKLAVACPNLQRLNLQQGGECLKNLQGLHSIASYCRNLEGLNLVGISAEDVENHTHLWEILSGMKLTHLAVEVCMLLPSVNKDKIKLIHSFKKCDSLQAVESLVCCRRCVSTISSNGLSMLSHFPNLIHFQHYEITDHYCSTTLHDIITSCVLLKYLMFNEHHNTIDPYLTPTCSCYLEQLCICSPQFDIPKEFMDSMSAHGGLADVELWVKSVTSEGITLLLMNSPHLLTFYASLEEEALDEDLDVIFKTKIPDHKLFKCGSYQVAETSSPIAQEFSSRPHGELISFWQ